MLWITLLAYIASWAAATKIITGWARDNQPVLLAHDRVEIGIVALFWPLIAAILLVMGIFILPTMRWCEISEAGEMAGWAFARFHGIGLPPGASRE